MECIVNNYEQLIVNRIKKDIGEYQAKKAILRLRKAMYGDENTPVTSSLFLNSKGEFENKYPDVYHISNALLRRTEEQYLSSHGFITRKQ